MALRDIWQWIEDNPLLAVGIGVGGAVAIGSVIGASAAGGSIGELLGGANVPTLSPGAVSSSTPSGYARSKLSFARRMWDGTEGALGNALRAMTPVVWPGVPPEVFVGFTTNGAKTANTALARPRGVRNAFAEMGYFGTEGGPRSAPDPNTGPYPHPTSTSNNSWLALHNDPLVVRALGHPATMAPNGWQTDIPAQTAVGLVNLRRRLDSVNRTVPAGTGASDPASTWAVALAFAGWSAGVGGTAGHVRRYASAIAAAPESGKLQAFQDAVLADIRAGRARDWPARSHGRNPAYTLIRTLQKMYAGRLLAETVSPGNVGWFPVPAPGDVQTEITRVAYGVRS